MYEELKYIDIYIELYLCVVWERPYYREPLTAIVIIAKLGSLGLRLELLLSEPRLLISQTGTLTSSVNYFMTQCTPCSPELGCTD